MTTAKHTPGPWYATTMGKAGWVDVFAHGVDIPIASTRHQDQEANARLIAAAPELLEALQSVLENCLDSEGLCAAHAKARAAVAKATGGAA